MANKNSFHLPQDVITEILLRLPVKILLRFRCVCKSWLSLISHDSNFATSHFRLSASPRLLFMNYNPNSLSIDFNASLYDDSTISSLCLRFLRPLSPLQIGGSCRGFLFLHCHKCLYLWNPSTGIQKKIPNSSLTIASDHSISTLLCGFAYDLLTDDYLVVLGSYPPIPPIYSPIDLEIFSLRANKWKQIEFDSHLPYTYTNNSVDGPRAGLYLNGCIHWLVYNYETKRNVIIAFDLKEMRMSKIAIPDDICRGSFFTDYDLFVFGGLISAWIRNMLQMNTVEIWVMQDYTVHSSWTKTIKFSFYPAPSFNPIYFTNCGDIVGRVGDGGLAKFSDEGHLLEHRSYDNGYFVIERSQMVVYTESLLSFPDSSEQA